MIPTSAYSLQAYFMLRVGIVLWSAQYAFLAKRVYILDDDWNYEIPYFIVQRLLGAILPSH